MMVCWEVADWKAEEVFGRRLRSSLAADSYRGRSGYRNRGPFYRARPFEFRNAEAARECASSSDDKGSIASGCRGEVENPALQSSSEYTPECSPGTQLSRFGQTPRLSTK